MRRFKKGLTLVELMIAFLILAVAILAIWGVFIYALSNTIQAREMNIATDDLKDVLEKIKGTPFSNIVGNFPDGGAINATDIGGFLLNNESITVTYPQGTTGDPLEIVLTITWTGKGGRSYSQIFKTVRTGML